MVTLSKSRLFPAILLVTTLIPSAIAETYNFGSGQDAFELEFVTIGNPGNVPDTRTSPQMGSVDYTFEIAIHEISCVMTRAAGLAEEQTMCMLLGEDHPAHLSWNRTAQFVNWLNESSGYPPAYKLHPDGRDVPDLWEPGEAGYDPTNPTRNAFAKFVLPDQDEWHKAAYYDPATNTYNLWATGNTEPGMLGSEGGTESNTAVYGPDVAGGLPVLADVTQAGGLSAFGTMGQTGNHGEWEEGPFDIDFLAGRRAIRAGAESVVIADQLSAISSRQQDRSGIWGFRVAAVTPVPEPASAMLLSLALLGLGTFRRRR